MRKFIKGIKIFLLLFFVFISVSALVGLYFVNQMIGEAPDIGTVDFSPKGFVTYIYDSNGEQIQKLVSDNANRVSVSINEIPENMQHAIVAIEDERFYEHNGVDYKGIVRALFYGIRHMNFSQGASTITQQLLKNNVFTEWTEEKTLKDRISRKIQEQYLAIQLEKQLGDKDLILENYLNTINLGAGTYGVQAASLKYFGKPVSELTLSECASIAAITQNPSRYNPISHPDNNEKRRNIVLGKMLELGYITQQEYEQAKQEDIYSEIEKVQKKAQAEEHSTVYSYFVDVLTEQVISDLQKQKGYSENEAYRLLYSGGLSIYTTQDPAVQKICDEEFQNEENFPENTEYELDWAISLLNDDSTQSHYSREMLAAYFKGKDPEFDLSFNSVEEAQEYIDEYKEHIMNGREIVAERTSLLPQPQASLVVIENGCVRAIIGGRGEKSTSLSLDRASKIGRIPGNTLSIISAYAEGLDSKRKVIGSFYKDEKFMYQDGTFVENIAKKYKGWMSLRTAIAKSVNTITVQLASDLGIETCYQRLKKFGINISNPDINQRMVLGEVQTTVSNLSVTAAYDAIANGGVYTKPMFYTKILDRNGDVLITNIPETSRAISDDNAFILSDAMSDSKDGANKQVEIGSCVSSTTLNDLWCVGFTSNYTMGIWCGYDDYRDMEDKNYQKVLWSKIMVRLNEGKDAEIKKPSGVVKKNLCGESGMLATGFCQHKSLDYVSSLNYIEEKCKSCKGDARKVVRASGFDEDLKNLKKPEEAVESEEEILDELDEKNEFVETDENTIVFEE